MKDSLPLLPFMVAFVVASSAGAYLRWQTNQWLASPLNTLLVNVVGSFAIGFFSVYMVRFSPQMKVVVLVAFLGALTTFSTYSLEIVRMVNEGQVGKALLYSVSSHVLALGGCFIGFRVAQSLVISS